MQKTITKNELKQKYELIISPMMPQGVQASKFLQGMEPTYYNVGKNGVNFEVYELDEDTCIIVGRKQRIGTPIISYIWSYYADEVEKFQGASKEYINDIRLNFVDDVKDYVYTGEVVEKFLVYMK